MPPSGEVVSDLEDLEEEEGAARAAQEYRAFKSGRMPYREEERREIVAAVVARRAHGRVRGNALWKVLEEEKLCRGNRTWQSMKEQYRKVGGLLLIFLLFIMIKCIVTWYRLLVDFRMLVDCLVYNPSE